MIVRTCVVVAALTAWAALAFSSGASASQPPTPSNYGGYYDLSLPDAQTYVADQLTAAGFTASEYPELFNSLTAAQALYAKANQLGIVIPDTFLANGQGHLNPVNEIVPSYSATSNMLSATVSSSVPGAYSIATTATIYNDTTPLGPTIGGIGVGEPSVAATASDSGGSSAAVYSASGAIVDVIPASQLDTATQQALGLQPTDSVALAMPVQASILTAASGYSIVNNAPTNVNKNNYMMLCFGRQGTDCDYFYPLGTIQMPINGSITFPMPIKTDPTTGQPVNPSYNVAIWYPDVGGGCEMPASTFASMVTASGNTLSWNGNPASFGSICAQYPYGQTVDVTYQLQVQVTSTTDTLMSATVTTAQNTAPSDNTLVLLPMEFVYGCLAEGSRITMDDGRHQLPIERVQPGQKLRGVGRRSLSVSAYWKGDQAQLIQITTRNHHKLAMTDNHPLPLANGEVKLAGHLRPGDRVTTATGVSPIAKIRKIKWNRRVWNLDLGTPDYHAKRLDMAAHSFFANGILVGDGRAQIFYNRVANRPPEDTLKRLPAAWHKDFLSALARHGTHERKADAAKPSQQR